MTEPNPQEQYRSIKFYIEGDDGAMIDINPDIVSESEMKMLARIRQAACQGRMVLIDPDSGTLWLLGKPEYTKLLVDRPK